MAPTRPPPEPTDAMLEEATAWLIDCNEGEQNATDRERFLEWLRRSPEHIRAYVEVAAAWEDSGRLRASKSTGFDALFAQALADRNVLEFTPSRQGTTATATATAGSPARKAATWTQLSLAAGLVALAIGAGYWVLALRGTYETGIGEQRSIVLEDGSTIALNTRSSVRVRYDNNERNVVLLNGQALFQVQKDVERPFVVRSNGTRVRAVGTQFDVNRKSTGTTVTVIEGRVAITPIVRVNEGERPKASDPSGRAAIGEATADIPQSRNASTGEVLLVAGQQLVVEPLLVQQPTQVDVAAVTAWTQHRLVFDEALLRDAIDEFNRYNTRQIVVEDPILAEYHIRGTFQATDPDRLIQFLRDRFDVRVVEAAGEIRVTRH